MFKANSRENWFIRLRVTRRSDLRGRRKLGVVEKRWVLGLFEQTNKNRRINFDFLGGRSETWLKPTSMRIGLFDSGGEAKRLERSKNWVVNELQSHSIRAGISTISTIVYLLKHSQPTSPFKQCAPCVHLHFLNQFQNCLATY